MRTLLAILFIAVVSCCHPAYAQLCANKVTGTVMDAHRHAVPGAVIRLVSDSAIGTVTDTNGYFVLHGLCDGHALLTCNALGYAEATAHIHVAQTNKVEFHLTSSSNQLHEVVVNGVRLQDLHSVAHLELKGLALLQTRGQSLGDALKELPGLNALQTGPTLSKPIIHGLHSNRVLVMNNGVRQEGQQWGTEHAPEIDPFVASRITVVKGAASVRYGSDAIGGVVLMDPEPLPTTKGITGDLYAIGASNNRMGVLSGVLQGAAGHKLKGLAWRAQGTLKNAGNSKAPGYYLQNTGLRETDFSTAVGYRHKGLELGLYYSQYRTRNGIFAGAHVGNLADLQAAFARNKPVTASFFSREIHRSYQQVYHDLAKANAGYRFANEGHLELILARQRDLREEYDVSLPYTKNVELLQKPQISFQLVTHSADLVYTTPNHKGFSGSMGVTSHTSGNVFKGIRYLVPNYRTYNAGIFGIERYTLKKMTFEAGLRYDYRWMRVYQLDNATLRPFNTTQEYRNATATAGMIYHATDRLTLSYNCGTAWRAPSINELYTHGIHFSDASYQDGDSTLVSERSVNNSLSVSYQGKRLRMGADVYYNYIHNYIYDRPSLQPITLISGTYPAFLFTQDNASIAGLDASLQWDINRHFTYQAKATLVRGNNITDGTYLIFMPSDRYENGIVFNLHQFRFLKEPYVSVENVQVLEQKRVPPNSDYVAPPGAYSLLNATAGFAMAIGKHTLHVDLSANNLTNTAYRNYLNRFRYYTDEQGINFIVRTRFSI